MVGALARALWAARPQCLPSFSALRFRAGDHIGCRDDRAQVEVLAGDEPAVFSRAIGCVLYLSKGWQPQYGGQFVDIAGRKWPLAPCFTPAFNTLLLFRVPHKYLVSAVRASGEAVPPLFAVHGWWLAEGELYSMDSDDEEEERGEEQEPQEQPSGPAAGTRSATAAAEAASRRDGKGELAHAAVPVPLPARLIPRELSAAKLRLISAKHCAAFQRDGLAVIDGALPPAWAEAVVAEVAALEASGAMAPTQQQTYGVRQDKVAWLTAATAPPHIRLALGFLTGVAATLNDRLRLSLLAPEAAMCTCYDGDGSHFIVHRDNTCDATSAARWAGSSGDMISRDECINAREATAIIYANTGWKSEDGGELRCHIGADPDDDSGESADRVRDIAPRAGRMVLFKSRELLHEVLPSHARRIAISLWLLDGSLPLRGDATA